MKESMSIWWMRRDLRLEDNAALFHALQSGKQVIPLFIFDKDILSKLEDKEDKRIIFIYQQLKYIQQKLHALGSSLLVRHGIPLDIFKELANSISIHSVFANHDYEPYAIKRDEETAAVLQSFGIVFHTFKDHVIFEKQEVVKEDGKPYTIYTPYSRKWMSKLNDNSFKAFPTEKYFSHFHKSTFPPLPSLQDIGFKKMDVVFPTTEIDIEKIKNYEANRNFPGISGTSRLGVHLRFGTISIRKLAEKASLSTSFLNELCWREFYQSILWHFPHVINNSFKPVYDKMNWRKDENDFNKWCNGITGYPIVDAGMRELNQTGFMHNRVRMITAGFLTKHLLIDWRWGEAYFAKKLLDFELASNNGGWQWAAGTGCDAAPYFRIFNPSEQVKKFDPKLIYIKKWIPELDDLSYPSPMIEHRFARERCLQAFKIVRE